MNTITIRGQEQPVRFAKAKHPDHPLVKLSDHLPKVALLPPVPSSCSWEPMTSWPDWGNSSTGDCVEYAEAACVLSQAFYGAGRMNMANSNYVVSRYFTETGGKDVGLDVPTSLTYWSNNPYNGSVLKAFAAIPLHDLPSLQFAINYFGGVIVVLNLHQTFAMDVNNHQVWSDVTSPPTGALHAVYVLGFASGVAFGPTWGAVQSMTYAYYLMRGIEAYVPITADWLSRTTTPGGLNVATLMADFAQVTGQPTPVVPPPPPPPPTPPPPPASTTYQVQGGSTLTLTPSADGRTYAVQGGSLILVP